ncbi:hypothetical protein TNCV_1124751 [Trichonephila clavipes]|uniref:Uncharacterized protein n=1 Tax=Trichonephila clavipes TaxID=2585209 RepID=A0A8X6VFQ1_TRICX|nr:hypothetical protein TNCV_1124751 [Trichonephila clavipes]
MNLEPTYICSLAIPAPSRDINSINPTQQSTREPNPVKARGYFKPKAMSIMTWPESTYIGFRIVQLVSKSQKDVNESALKKICGRNRLKAIMIEDHCKI